MPYKIKIGGKTYTVEINENLYLGRANNVAEILTDDAIIRISPHSPERQFEYFIHELVHGVAYFMGLNNHDEQKIEQIAQAVYMVINDNPEIFEKEGNKNES